MVRQCLLPLSVTTEYYVVKIPYCYCYVLGLRLERNRARNGPNELFLALDLNQTLVRPEVRSRLRPSENPAFPVINPLPINKQSPSTTLAGLFLSVKPAVW